MNPGVVICCAFKDVACTFICVVLIVTLVRNKGAWLKPEAIRDEKWRESSMRYEGWVKAFCTGTTALLAWAVLSQASPLMQDVPHIAHGEYLEAEGLVISDSLGGAAGRVQDREFAIKDEATGEEIYLMALSAGLKEGEYVKVTYLPNSHLATINYRE